MRDSRTILQMLKLVRFRRTGTVMSWAVFEEHTKAIEGVTLGSVHEGFDLSPREFESCSKLSCISLVAIAVQNSRSWSLVTSHMGIVMTGATCSCTDIFVKRGPKFAGDVKGRL